MGILICGLNGVGKSTIGKKLAERLSYCFIVFAAVKGDYGDKLLKKLDYAILVEAPKETRLERVKRRSAQKFGDRILADGDLSDIENSWFAKVNSRPEDFVTSWLEGIECPVIRIDGMAPVEENVEYILSLQDRVCACRQ